MSIINLQALSKPKRDKLKAEIVFRFYNDKLNGIDDIANLVNTSRFEVSRVIDEYLKPSKKTRYIILESKMNTL